ncbi:hypothetical protein ACFT8W_25500 [Streptomyces hygroscopicus]|uniref:hypothetical protein n=1 Tax=Streptomyces hygroscopicus TaxID=1912 RepID=UPI00364313E0
MLPSRSGCLLRTAPLLGQTSSSLIRCLASAASTLPSVIGRPVGTATTGGAPSYSVPPSSFFTGRSACA